MLEKAKPRTVRLKNRLRYAVNFIIFNFYQKCAAVLIALRFLRRYSIKICAIILIFFFLIYFSPLFLLLFSFCAVLLKPPLTVQPVHPLHFPQAAQPPFFRCLCALTALSASKTQSTSIVTISAKFIVHFPLWLGFKI